jgi:hypothetical protein
MFLDESGNSGGKLNTPEQPFFVIGGWQVQESYLDKSHFIEEFITINKLTKDSKGANLIKGKNSYKLLELIDKIIKNGIMPVFHISEKRFVICAKIVETLMDPMYNEELDDKFTYEVIRKKGIANEIYDFEDELIYNIADAYFDKNINEMTKHFTNLTAIIDKNNSKLAKVFSAGIKNLYEQFDFSSDSSWGSQHKKIDSINVSAIIALLNQTNNIARSYNSDYLIVHDEIASFQETYDYLINTLREKKERKDIYLENGIIINTHYDRIKQMEYKTEKSDLWLIASDYLVSTINYGLKEKLLGRKLDQYFNEIFGNLVSILFIPDYHHSDFLGSEKLQREIIFKSAIKK